MLLINIIFCAAISSQFQQLLKDGSDVSVFFRDANSVTGVRPSSRMTVLFQVRNSLNRANVYYYPTQSKVKLSLLEGSKRSQPIIMKNITLPVHFYRSHTDGKKTLCFVSLCIISAPSFRLLWAGSLYDSSKRPNPNRTVRWTGNCVSEWWIPFRVPWLESSGSENSVQ